MEHWGMLRPKEEEEWHEYKHILVETSRPITLFNKTKIRIIVNGN